MRDLSLPSTSRGKLYSSSRSNYSPNSQKSLKDSLDDTFPGDGLPENFNSQKDEDVDRFGEPIAGKDFFFEIYSPDLDFIVLIQLFIN